MKEGVKLIWDFRGPNAELTAKHHAIHLEEFVTLESIAPYICATERITDMHHIAYLVVEKEHMDALRERLKPNRGQLYSNEK